MLDDATTLATGQRVEARTADTVVRAYQEELLRTAYLLTGDQEQAAAFAENAYVAQLRPLLHADDDLDWRARLLHALAVCYLAAPLVTERHPHRAIAQARYAVDDERDRIWSALDLCDPPQRLALTLRDFNRLDEEAIANLTRWHTPDLRERLGAARTRLRDAVGARSDHPTSTVLMTLSLGAPRLDLWAALAGRVREIAEAEERRRRLLTWGALGAVALLVVLGALWLADVRLRFIGGDEARAAVAGPTATPRATATPLPTATATLPLISRPVVTVPDRHIIQFSYPVDNAWRSETRIFDPATGEWSEPRDFGQFGNVNISPDGQWLVDVWTEDLGDGEIEQTLTVREAAIGAVVWERVTPPDVWQQLHLFADRVYALQRPRNGTGFEIPRLVAYDIATGEPLGDWEFDVQEMVDGGLATAQAWLFRPLAGDRLYLVIDQTNDLSGVGRRTIIRYGFEDMTFEGQFAVYTKPEERGGQPPFGVWGTRVTPDGEALYQDENVDDQVRVRFLELDTGELSAVEIPLAAPLTNSGAFTVSTSSHDGRRIYVISNTGEVAVFDLARRRVERVFQLDTAGYRFPANDGSDDMWHSGMARFAPDGSRLYLLDTWRAQSGELTPDVTTTLWVVDVAHWRIAGRWELPGAGNALVLNADGSRAFVESSIPPEQPSSGANWENSIYAIDTQSGVLQRLDELLFRQDQLPDDALRQAWSTITTLQQAYYYAYGVMPAAGGVTPHDLTEFSTLPLLELTTEEAVIAAGQQARFAMRFLAPTTRQPLTASAPEVRFDPAAVVSVTLSHAEQPDIIVIPLKVDATTWEAALPLDVFGAWDATVSVSYSDGTQWSSRWPALFAVAPSFLGDDGKRYAYHLSLNPEEPVVDEPATMRVALLAIEDGAPLPQGVELDGGLPERINVVMQGESSKSETLPAVAYGVWEDELSFRWADTWQAELSIRQPDVEGLPLRIYAGTVRVVLGAH